MLFVAPLLVFYYLKYSFQTSKDSCCFSTFTLLLFYLILIGFAFYIKKKKLANIHDFKKRIKCKKNLYIFEKMKSCKIAINYSA